MLAAISNNTRTQSTTIIAANATLFASPTNNYEEEEKADGLVIIGRGNELSGNRFNMGFDSDNTVSCRKFSYGS